ncbi:uncharacterized protein EHS24_000539 [Apiotrichum porosum]|uniref:NF-kappa-B-activating protein C-terminal domain-containing protein n=1 Tax=Apiotrichum porosum TaxID=105984 RepID=A0A427YAG7_9TREE|nr:uncharacterized protein EHS24_000539 [Apiotrichum porosum]RSH88015.1 hypothetical protein EHS24_000539 [Apiotrichum porosum]
MSSHRSSPPPPHSMPPFQPTLAPAFRSHPGQLGQQGQQGPVNLEERRQIREKSEISIWPPSPKVPYAEQMLEREDKARRSQKSSKSRRRRRYTSESDDSDAERERERRRARRRQRERERDDDKDKDRKRRHRSRTADDDWVEKSGATGRKARSRSAEREREHDTQQAVQASELPADDEGPEVGPQLPLDPARKYDRGAFRDLLPGEGQAMQRFLEKGERIPRRGEIGLDSKQISAYEEAGYVMSGSRHQRMTAVRLRKEGQVINAEEKWAILKMQREEREKKEGAIISQFKEMMDERLQMEERRERDAQRDREERDQRDK